MRIVREFFVLLGIICLSVGFPIMVVAQNQQMPQQQAAENAENPSDSIASEPSEPISDEEAEETTSLVDEARDTLKNLVWSMKDLETEYNLKQQEFRLAQTDDEKAVVKEEMAQIREKLDSLKRSLEEVAAGVDLDAYYGAPEKEFDWRRELLQLIQPLVRELNDLTARPRQIEALRTEIKRYETQLQTIAKVQDGLKVRLEKASAEDKMLRAYLEGLAETWANRENQVKDQLTLLRYQLKDLTDQQESILDSTQNALKSFFRSRGRNFVLAILAAVFVFMGMRYGHRLMHRYSPIHRKPERTFAIRLIDVLYHVFTGIAAGGALLIVLYISGDWLLLSFFIIFLLGLAWTAKEGIPRYWRQIQLMLNLGTVRENERIVYNGIPWRVVTLSFFAKLENPALKPATLSVPLKDIMNLNSRPYDDGEPWFPCRMNEWVILADGTRGEVISQTPEMVQLKLRGDSVKTYLTPDFLGQSPHNISVDFRLKVVFGLDYAHQSVITGEIPRKLTASLRSGMEKQAFGADVRQLKVEVECAGASSLDLVVIADFAGKQAPLYNAIKRFIQKIAIDTCTAEGWGIPFPQLTVHKAE